MVEDDIDKGSVDEKDGITLFKQLLNPQNSKQESLKQFAYTISVNNVGTISFVCSEDKADYFIDKAREEIQKIVRIVIPSLGQDSPPDKEQIKDISQQKYIS